MKVWRIHPHPALRAHPPHKGEGKGSPVIPAQAGMTGEGVATGEGTPFPPLRRGITLSSCPALCRVSTSFPQAEGVDGRDRSPDQVRDGQNEEDLTRCVRGLVSS